MLNQPLNRKLPVLFMKIHGNFHAMKSEYRGMYHFKGIFGKYFSSSMYTSKHIIQKSIHSDKFKISATPLRVHILS